MPVRYEHLESKKYVFRLAPLEQELGKQSQSTTAIRMPLYSPAFKWFVPLISDIAWRLPDGQNEVTNNK